MRFDSSYISQKLIKTMRAFNYRSIYAVCSFQKPKYMILTHTNTFSQFAFLGLNLSDINSTFASVWSQSQSHPLIAFMKILNQHRYVIQHAQDNEYNHIQLSLIQKGQEPACIALNKYYQKLLELKDRYSELCSHVQSQANKQNLFLWLEVCQKLDIIESTVWSRIFSIIIQNFDGYNFQQQTDIINYSHRYIKRKFISFTHIPAKFVYRENYLVDITNFRPLFRLFVNCMIKGPNDNMELKLQVLQKVNDLIEKISKTYALNLTQMAANYIKDKSYFELMAKLGSTEILIQLLRYLGIIGMYDKNFFNMVEAKILQKWTKEKPDLTQIMISHLLAAWANVFHYNQFIFSHFLKPYIDTRIANNTKSRHHSIWLFNIAACNIRDFQFLQRFSNKILHDSPTSNIYLHIISHYVAVLQDKKGIDAFPMCSQHPFTQKILQRHGKSHLNCMDKLKEQGFQDYYKVATTNQKGRQHNTSQGLWVFIARKAFEILKERYPHNDNCFYTNYRFCSFQLDTMIMLKGIPITFEWQGTHYKMKEGSQNYGQAYGKKMIKQAILRGYGIHILDLSTTNYIERNISSFKDRIGGVRYLVDRLEKIVKDHA